MKKNVITTQCLNGILKVGDIVMNTPLDDYPTMHGRVIEILPAGSEEALAETDNEGDVIHVEFQIEGLSEQYAKALEEEISSMYCGDTDYTLEDFGLEDVIEGGDVLLRIDDYEAYSSRLTHSLEAATSVAFELMADYASKMAAIKKSLVTETQEALEEYWSELEDSLGTVRLDEEIESVQAKMAQVRSLQSRLNAELGLSTPHLLISVCERDVTTEVFSTFDAAHAQMEKELDEALSDDRDDYTEGDDYEISESVAWSNPGANNDWVIINL